MFDFPDPNPFHRITNRAQQWALALSLSALCAWEWCHPSPAQQAFWFTLILFVASFVLSELLRPKPSNEARRPEGLGDFRFPTATESRVVPLLFGRIRIYGSNVVWWGDLQQTAITESVKTGLFSSTRVITGYQFSIGMQSALCRGPDCVLKRVWIDNEEVYSGTVASESYFDIDEPELFVDPELDTSQDAGGIQATIDFYGGETTQAVNAYLDDPDRQQIAMTVATDSAPRYSGLCHAVVRELTSAAPSASDMGAYLGNSTSIKTWDWEVERYSGLFSGQTSGENQIGADVNPINVIYEVLTNDEWGFGFSSSDVDVGASSSFLDASDTMIAEVNGFAMLIDNSLSATDFLSEVERQIDGIVFLDHTTGLWTIQLAREAGHTYFGYSIGSVPQFTDSNVSEVRDFLRGGWEDTTNHISVKFADRDQDYKESFAIAQDVANALIQGGGTVTTSNTVSAQMSFPGVKNGDLASILAWRELRGQSYPLARATFIVDRTFWDLTIGQVIAWTSTTLGFTQLPMRVTRINYGQLQDNKIEVQAVQDVFAFMAASYGSPPASGWTPPSTSLVAFPSAQQLAEEAPRGILVRDPTYAGDDTVSKVFCAARRQGGEVAFTITQRNASGSPAGSYADSGGVAAFVRIGELNSALAAGTAIPTTAITITATPDSQSTLEAAFDDAATVADMGVDLVQLIKVDDEYMLVQSASDNGANVDLENVYRGVLDSAQQSHASGADVFLLHLGGGLADTIFNSVYNVDIELRMRSSSDTFAGAVTTIGLTMANRPGRPYPPASLAYNSGAIFNTPALEGDGSGLDGVGFDIDWRRRRYNCTDELNELLQDNSVDASTEYRVRLYSDPSGANTLIYTSSWATGASLSYANRLEILDAAAVGTEVRVRIDSRHDTATLTNVESRYTLDHDVTPSSTLGSQFYFGAGLRALVVTNAYTAAATGTFTVNIGSTFNSQIQYRLNSGSWVNLSGYTAGSSTTGTIAGVSSSDTIELQHLVNPATSLTFIELKNPSSVSVAYGVLSN